MPYKDPERQREASRVSAAKRRQMLLAARSCSRCQAAPGVCTYQGVVYCRSCRQALAVELRQHHVERRNNRRRISDRRSPGTAWTAKPVKAKSAKVKPVKPESGSAPKQPRAKKEPVDAKTLTLASFEAEAQRRAERKAWRDERRKAWRLSQEGFTNAGA